MTKHKSRRLRHAETAHDDLARVLTAHDDGVTVAPLLVHAIHRIMDARPGHPGAANYDGTGSSNAPASHPPPGFRVDDPAAHDLKILDDSLRRIEHHTRLILNVVEAWAPRQPSRKAQEAAEASNVPRCHHCGSTDPVYRSGTVSGNLSTTMALCRWDYEYVQRTGKLAGALELERRDRGQQVRIPG